jgi:hypothetical protein
VYANPLVVEETDEEVTPAPTPAMVLALAAELDRVDSVVETPATVVDRIVLATAEVLGFGIELGWEDDAIVVLDEGAFVATTGVVDEMLED